MEGKEPPRIYAIGHSTRPIHEFIALLKQNGIKQLVDIRTVPRSRFNPQHEQGALRGSLENAGIHYVYLKELGGLSPKVKDSINTGWRVESFRNYADYMQTDAFAAAIDTLINLAEDFPSAIMCAEAAPWRCHRSLVADALVIRRVKVLDIISEREPEEHHLTDFALAREGRITYPQTGQLSYTKK